MAMAAFTTEGTEGPNVFDANGFKVAKGNEGFITTSVGGATDRQRMILTHEWQELENSRSPSAPQGLPRTETINTDRVCIQAADKALSIMQAQVNKIPQPTWVSDKAAFSHVMNGLFEAEGEKRGVSPSRMNSAVDTYNLRPQAHPDVTNKSAMVQSQIRQMDELVAKIDKSFDEIAKLAKSPQDLKALSLMGVTSIDGIYAVDPGYFEPKDGEGRPTKYDPKNITHVLQAIDHFMQNPARAMMAIEEGGMGMHLFGPKAIDELRLIVGERAPTAPGNNFDASPGIMNQVNSTPGAIRMANADPDGDPNDPTTSAGRRRQSFVPPLPGRPFA